MVSYIVIYQAPILARREMLETTDEDEVRGIASLRMLAARGQGYSDGACSDLLRPSVPVLKPENGKMFLCRTMLHGLSPAAFGWDLRGFLEKNKLDSEHDMVTALQLLAVEYDDEGVNESFKCFLQGTTCVLGCAGRQMQKAHQEVRLGPVPLGGSIGRIDCHIGGVPGSSTEASACLHFNRVSGWSLLPLAKEDVVTVNGAQVAVGSVATVRAGDVCSVGPRVFCLDLD